MRFSIFDGGTADPLRPVRRTALKGAVRKRVCAYSVATRYFDGD
jgi:hypothetical protein